MTSYDAVPGEARTTPAVRLRPLLPDDAVRIRKWMGDPELVRFTVLVPGPEYALDRETSTDATERYIDQLLTDPKRLSLAILDGGTHVGNIGLKDFEYGRPEAECFIEIGEQRHRGQGVGRLAMHLLMRHCFSRLLLRSLRLGVFDFNHGAIRLYQALGFSHTGRYAWHWCDGRYHEVLGMRMDRTRYDDLFGTMVLPR
jgi:RimJ/RimL family protein N-acetyltransferase